MACCTALLSPRAEAFVHTMAPQLQFKNAIQRTSRGSSSLAVAMIDEQTFVGSLPETLATKSPASVVTLPEQTKREVPNIGTVMKMLPKSSFDVNTPTSLFYFGIDAIAVIGSMGYLSTVVHSDIYRNSPMFLQAAMAAPLQVLTGFAMWCMWCIGHDAGHSLISKRYKWLNHVVGEISHSMICLTPFVPWQLSHRRHHCNHNHLTADYSHQWFIREEKDDLEWWIKASYEMRNLQLPVLYLVYLLLGIPDGGHVFFYGRLWEGHSEKTKRRASLSVLISAVTAGSLWYNLGTADFFVICMVPWMIMSFWLFMVTYLQHHSDDGKLYTDDSWTFAKGAFETVDRSYGNIVDRMSHHMMSGHVLHHLLFEKVPHYRLEEATKAMVAGLEKSGQSDLYKYVETKDFTQEILRQFNENWFFVDEKQVVRE
jgi:omega-3 fatty acid desaturase (delta-15 desaturase)